MEQQRKRINYRLLLFLFIIYEIVFLFLFKTYDKENYSNMLATALIFFFLFGVYMIILSRCEDKIFNKNNKVIYFYLGILISIICVPVSEMVEIYHIWMLGCILISVSCGAYIGIITSFLILFIDGLCKGYSPEEYIYYEALAIVLCLLFEFLPDTRNFIKNLISYFYFMVIGLSCNVSLYLITNKLNFELLFDNKFYFNVLSTAVMVTIIYGIWYIFIFNTNKHIDEDNYLDIILNNDFELLQKLKNELPLIYKHSIVVADISKKQLKKLVLI